METLPADIAIIQARGASFSQLGLSGEIPAIINAMLRLSVSPDRKQPLLYQQELLRSGSFRLSESLASSSAIVIDGTAVLYFFAGNTRYAVIARSPGEAFGLIGLIDAEQRVCYNLGDAVWGILPDHLMKFRQALSERTSRSGQRGGAYILTGHDNFAHMLWNQLSALEHGLGIAADPHLPVVAMREPLGPLDQLMPGLAPGRIIRLRQSRLSSLNDGAAKSFIPLGCSLIDRGLRRRLVETFIAAMSPQARVMREALLGRRVAILTIRAQNRTATNLVEVLAKIAAGILDRHPDARILLDGHSLPADYGNIPNDPVRHDAVSAACKEIAEAIRTEVARRNGSAERIVTAVGFSLPDSIAIGSTGGFYFAHHGSVQHKIGWLHDMPGIVHSNPRTLATQPSNWVADQVEGGVEPVYLPEAVTEAQANIGSERQAYLRHENYRFTDPAETSAFVVSRAVAALS